jgi:hypothetical protein
VKRDQPSEKLAPAGAKWHWSTLAAGALLGGLLVYGLRAGSGSDGGDGSTWPRVCLASELAGLAETAAGAPEKQDPESQDQGRYLFLPNRRSIWVVDRRAGRFANYHFRDDDVGTVERSQVITLDKRIFRPEDTVYLLSDRNFTEVFWVCNRRTGLVQLWIPSTGGKLRADRPVETRADLSDGNR